MSIHGIVDLHILWYYNKNLFLCINSWLGGSVDENMDMWVSEPNILDDGRHQAAVFHLDTIVHLVHLLPIYGEEWAPRGMKYTDSLDTFSEFYVNKFADYHTFEIAFWFILIVAYNT